MKIAIDIALIPPQPIIDLVAQINVQARDRGETDRRIDGVQYMPHMTILMGTIDETRLSEASKHLAEIAKRHAPLLLTMDHFDREALAIDNTEAIRALHEDVMAHINPLVTHEPATLGMFAEPAGTVLGKSNVGYFPNFMTKGAHENYWPHITTWTPTEAPAVFPLFCTATTLALYHMGNNCTCAKKIVSFELTEQT